MNDPPQQYEFPFETGSRSLKNFATAYEGPYSAIGDLVDNSHDLAIEDKRSKVPVENPTTKLFIRIESTGHPTHPMVYSFMNDGHGCKAVEDLRQFFNLGLSHKAVDPDLIGQYGTGLKAASMYLGDTIGIWSYSPTTKRLIFGFYSNARSSIEKDDPAQRTARFLACDVSNRKSNVVLEEMTAYSHFSTTGAILKVFDQLVAMPTGGTVVKVIAQKDTCAKLFNDQQHFELTSNGDMRAIKPDRYFKIDKWNSRKKARHGKGNASTTRDEYPAFASSLYAYLSVLYLDRALDKVYLNGREVPKLDLQRDSTLRLGQHYPDPRVEAGMSPKKWRFFSTTFVDAEERAERFNPTYEVKHLVSRGKKTPGFTPKSDFYLYKWNTRRTTLDPSERHGQDYDGIWKFGEGVYIYRRGRLIDIDMTPDHNAANSVARNTIMIVNSNCVNSDIPKQKMLRGCQFRDSIVSHAKLIVYETCHPGSESRKLVRRLANHEDLKNDVVLQSGLTLTQAQRRAVMEFARQKKRTRTGRDVSQADFSQDDFSQEDDSQDDFSQEDDSQDDFSQDDFSQEDDSQDGFSQDGFSQEDDSQDATLDDDSLDGGMQKLRRTKKKRHEHQHHEDASSLSTYLRGVGVRIRTPTNHEYRLFLKTLRDSLPSLIREIPDDNADRKGVCQIIRTLMKCHPTWFRENFEQLFS